MNELTICDLCMAAIRSAAGAEVELCDPCSSAARPAMLRNARPSQATGATITEVPITIVAVWNKGPDGKWTEGPPPGREPAP